MSDSSPIQGQSMKNTGEYEEARPLQGTYNKSSGLESMCSLDMSHLTFLTNDKVATSIPYMTNNHEMRSQSSIPSNNLKGQSLKEFKIKKVFSRLRDAILV